MASEAIQSTAQKVYDYLKGNCVGEQISTSEALMKVCPDGFVIGDEEDLWDIDEALKKLVNKERRFVFDPGEDRDCIIGLPFNCPFYFIPRGAKSPAWKIRIPYFKTGEDYFQWIQDIPESSLPEPYVRYFTRILHSTQDWGYEKPISKQRMYKALKRSQRTGKMITVVPDDEFLPGGSSEGQCDGWTYHLEFVSMRDYFSQDYDSRLECGETLPPKDKWVDCIVNEPNYIDYIDEYK